MAKHLALYPGSFDPMTFGHLDVIARGRRLFDELVVGVGQNPGKDHLFSLDERVDMAQSLVRVMVEQDRGGSHDGPPAAGISTRPPHSSHDASPPSLAPVIVRPFSGLTVDFARSLGATVLLRGVRNMSDLQYEVQQAITNREVAGLETAFVVAGQTFAYTSSSLIKQIAALGDDLSALSAMVPTLVIDRLREKKRTRHPMLERLRMNE